MRLLGAVVVSISYRLAPEHKWPVPWNDAWDNTVWIAAHAAELGADPEKGFVVGGVSAGGAMSAFIASQPQNEPLVHTITGKWLSVPSLMPANSLPPKYQLLRRSMIDNKDAPILSA